MSSEKQLSRREREIMDIVYAQGQATAASIREAMHEAPGAATCASWCKSSKIKGTSLMQRLGVSTSIAP